MVDGTVKGKCYGQGGTVTGDSDGPFDHDLSWPRSSARGIDRSSAAMIAERTNRPPALREVFRTVRAIFSQYPTFVIPEGYERVGSESEFTRARSRDNMGAFWPGVLLEEKTARAVFIARKSLKGTVFELRPVDRSGMIMGTRRGKQTKSLSYKFQGLTSSLLCTDTNTTLQIHSSSNRSIFESLQNRPDSYSKRE
jgi:hypothetical protein